MDLLRLDVVRLPGLDRPFALTFEPGVNLILGANGAGKSSVCRAVLDLIFTDCEARGVDPRVDVSAVFASGASRWRATRRGATPVVWQPLTDAAPARRPEALRAPAYHLGLLDLHKAGAEQTDTALAAEIRSRMAGGYDVSGLLASAFVVPKRSTRAAELHASAVKQLESVRRELEALATDEDHLPVLARELRAAEHTAATLPSCELAQRLAAIDQREAATTARLVAFDAAVAHLRGDELARLDQWEGARKREAAAIAAAAAAVAQAEQDLATSGLSAPLAERTLGELRLRRQTWQTAETEASRLAAELAGAAGAAAECARQLDLPADRTAWPDVAIADIDDAARALHAVAAHAAEDDALARLLAREDLAALPDHDDVATTREAIAHLAAWLAAPDPSGNRVGPALLLATAVVLAGGGLVWLGAGGHPLGWLLVAAGAGVAGATYSERRAHGEWAAQRRRAAAALASTGAPAPRAWDRPSVLAHLRDLTDQFVNHLDEARRRAWRDQLRADRARVQEQRASALEPVPSSARQLAQAAVATSAGAVDLLHRVHAYQAAVVRHQELLAQHDAAVARMRAEGDACRQSLPANVAAADANAAAAAIEDLSRRTAAHVDAARRRVHNRQLHDAAQERLAAVDADWTALFTELGLAPGAVADLQRLAGQRLPYLDAVQERDAAKAARREIEQEIAKRPDQAAEIRRLATASPEAQLAARERAQAATAMANELREQKGRIEGQAQQARAGSRVEAALAAVEHARVRWEAEQSTALDNALARVCLQAAAADHATLAQPAVLERAQTLFGRFCTGRYELRVRHGSGAAEFFAVDTASLQPLSLVELSDGTRAQLLLAARLAFIQDGELDEPLPLLLDESLIASDPARFAAVAIALLDLVRLEHRQIIVLTAGPATVAAWQGALTAAGLPPAPVTDLGQVRGAAAAAPTGALTPSAPAPIPSPGADDPVTYARRLNVPPLEVHATAAAAHLYYLLSDDLAALRLLLAMGARDWGACAALQKALADGLPGLDAALRARLAARAVALDAFLAARRIGRHRPLSREALFACEAVARSAQGQDIDDVRSRLDGDPSRLLAALANREVRNLRATVQEDLARHLRDEGFLDDRPALTRSEAHQRVIAAVAGPLRDGVVEPSELAGLVDAWWQVTESRGASPS